MSEELNEQVQTEQVETEVVTEQTTVEEPANKPEVKTVTMTQEELDALIGREKGRVKNKYADYSDLKAAAEELAKLKEERELADLGEKERAEKLAQKYEAEKTEIAQQLEALKESVKNERIKNEFTKVATGLGVAYIDDALQLADLSAVSVGEDGEIVGVEDVVKGLVENKPFLVAQKKPQKPIGESSNGVRDTSDKTAQQLLQEAADRYKRTGKPEDMVAYSKLKRELNS
ncbi:phage scaffolding protein [Priestia megaterium]|uniref:phage scaffolding protein n=1 Tax=Priestia megaterium TaxID=1404 RepID=UPI003459E047